MFSIFLKKVLKTGEIHTFEICGGSSLEGYKGSLSLKSKKKVKLAKIWPNFLAVFWAKRGEKQGLQKVKVGEKIYIYIYMHTSWIGQDLQIGPFLEDPLEPRQ